MPAEVRVRYIPDISDYREAKKLVKSEWSCMNAFNPLQSREQTEVCLKDEWNDDEDMRHVQKVVKMIVNKWDTNMHLYTRNCRHFSSYCKYIIAKEEVCAVKE